MTDPPRPPPITRFGTQALFAELSRRGMLDPEHRIRVNDAGWFLDHPQWCDAKCEYPIWVEANFHIVRALRDTHGDAVRLMRMRSGGSMELVSEDADTGWNPWWAHGEWGTYTAKRCRCEECKAAASLANAAQFQKRKKRGYRKMTKAEGGRNR